MTILIPKVNKPSSYVENWRPITIGLILGQIFSSILDRRIRRDVMFNLRQKGFTSENDCKVIVALLNAALNYGKRNNGAGGLFTIVEISKAFDTIPHLALKPCMTRKDVPTHIIELIESMYKEGKKNIKAKCYIGVEIKILRGVKQIDPLSLLLLNLCLEPLLEIIEEQMLVA